MRIILPLILVPFRAGVAPYRYDRIAFARTEMMILSRFDDYDIAGCDGMLIPVDLHDSAPLKNDESFAIRVHVVILPSRTVIRMASFARPREGQPSGAQVIPRQQIAKQMAVRRIV
jgi:hypothetical protein